MRCVKLLVWLCVIVMGAAAVAEIPEPSKATAEQREGFGRGIQRTMGLLEGSTAEQRNRVKILFYGQSITVQPWWRGVEARLRERYPYADLIVENKALGGWASQNLIRMTPIDVPLSYPDLVVFHVYGSHIDYEAIIRYIRTHTAAEVMIWNDHVNRWPEPFDAQKDRPGGGGSWDNFMNVVHLPAVAERYGAGLADIRAMWGDYLKANGFEPNRLLKDGVHLNGDGEELMAELIGRYFVYRPELENGLSDGLVREYVVGKDVVWEDGVLTMAFDGNRVEVLAAEGAERGGEGGAARVLIDGEAPSERAALYQFTRPSAGQANIWPALQRISSRAKLLIEDWTVTVTEAGEKSEALAFTIEGSVTGVDGGGRVLAEAERGDAPEPFVSDSGRVVIEQSDWNLAREAGQSGVQVERGFRIRFSVVPMFVDRYETPMQLDGGKDNAVMLFSGLEPGRHELKLIAGGKRPMIRVIRVYRPPFEVD